jgi:hypothetical protein
MVVMRVFVTGGTGALGRRQVPQTGARPDVSWRQGLRAEAA